MKTNNKSIKRFMVTIPIIIILLFIIIIFLRKERNAPSSAYALSVPEYPIMAPYPDELKYLKEDGSIDYDEYDKAHTLWYEDVRKQWGKGSYALELKPYFETSMRQFLVPADKQSNTLFSPLNVYIALGMLAEVTDGNSRQQILSLIGVDSIETLRIQISEIWNSTYRNDGAVTSILANSLWLNEDISFKEDTLKNLSEYYYASSFQGKMGSDKYNKALQEWLDTQTGGLLGDQIKNMKMDPNVVMALASTIYFQTKWQEEFHPEHTKEGIFHGAAGDVSADYMNSQPFGNYCWDDDFSAYAKELDSGGKMWFILPDEGISPTELLNNSRMTDMVLNQEEWENKKYVLINASIPKFDVTSQMNLVDDLKDLGLTDIFDMYNSNFTPMTDEIETVYLSKAQHDCRVAIDEQGVTAAAYTVMQLCGSGMPQDEVDFVVDRPFLFVITNRNHLPLFAGIVNHL